MAVKLMKVHTLEGHKDKDCLNCSFNPDESTVLKDHKSDCNVMKQSNTTNDESDNIS